MVKKRSLVNSLNLLYPFLFALYPGLALVAHNLSEMELSDSFRSLAISLLFASILFIISKLYFRDWPRSSLLAVIVLILIFSYGHVYSLLRDVTIFDLRLFRHRVLGLIWVGFFVFGIWAVSRKWLHPEKLAPSLTVVAIVALAIPVWIIADFQIRAAEIEDSNSAVQQSKTTSQSVADEQNLPDIYYIILDGYVRDDYLLEFLDYDNSPFLDWLAGRGFYVAQCSQSNYAQTIFSLTSTLNLNYIDAFYEASYQSDYQAQRYKQGLTNFLKHSHVREFLEQHGYSIIAFETGGDFTEIEDADIYYDLESKSFWQSTIQGVNGYEVLLIRGTALLFLTAVSPNLAEILLPDLDFPHKLHRERVLFVLDKLESIPANNSRKFVFAHIVSPHPPYVFGANGEIWQWSPGFRTGYPDQINYLNTRVKGVIDSILKQSVKPPIIILQGDHGATQSGGEEGRMAILNAYYLPGEQDLVVYDSISPVNTFRVIFNEYFGQDFDLLTDKSLYSNYITPLNYRLIPESGQRCQE